MKYDLLVFIGRFQPLHLGHQEVIERARSLAKNVLVLVGSAGKARSARNPFSYEERRKMIQDIYPDVWVQPINDHTYNDNAWILEVKSKIPVPPTKGPYKIGLIGCDKDHTSFYLKLFPEWGSVGVDFVNPLNATAIREMLYSGSYKDYQLTSVMDNKTVHTLHELQPTINKMALLNKQNVAYKAKWGKGPHLTGDALVQVGGNILLITRKDNGLLAMPGGFLHEDERFRDGAVRELREETRLRVPVPVLLGSTAGAETFDDPHRSERGRIVTRCFYFKLLNETSLPEVRGSDDAKNAGWYNFAELEEEQFHDDHYHIIKYFLGVN